MKKRSQAEAAALIATYEATPDKPRGKPEWQIQTGIAKLLTAAGFAVYSTSQGFRPAPGGTRMTPGIPDLYVVDRRGEWGAFWIEVKTETGQLNPAQRRFAELHNDDVNLPAVRCWRSVEDCRKALVAAKRALP